MALPVLAKAPIVTRFSRVVAADRVGEDLLRSIYRKAGFDPAKL